MEFGWCGCGSGELPALDKGGEGGLVWAKGFLEELSDEGAWIGEVTGSEVFSSEDSAGTGCLAIGSGSPFA